MKCTSRCSALDVVLPRSTTNFTNDVMTDELTCTHDANIKSTDINQSGLRHTLQSSGQISSIPFDHFVISKLYMCFIGVHVLTSQPLHRVRVSVRSTLDLEIKSCLPVHGNIGIVLLHDLVQENALTDIMYRSGTI